MKRWTAALPALVFGLASLGLTTTGCKRSRAPRVEEVWNEPPADGQAEALGALAPPWPAPTQAVLDDGLITYWLHEPDAVTTHVRLLLPTQDVPALQSAAVLAVLQAHLQQTLASRGRSRGIDAQARSGPDRIEVALHGPVDETARALTTLGKVLAAKAPTGGLDSARQQVLGTLQGPVSSSEVATASLVAQLLGRETSSQLLLRGDVEAVPPETLLEAWEALADPRRSVLVVHSGSPAAQHRPALRELAERWHGLGRRPVPPTALERLRHSAAPAAVPGRLLAEPTTPLRVIGAPKGNKPVALLGRIIPTATAEDRSLARLAQRVLQEEADASLVVHGDVSVLVLRVPLSTQEPERSLTEAIDALVTLGSQRQPQQRLFQAAQLWLGARVVQASLDGEDWTALWSEAMDLADRDEDIVGALAKDARGMLEPDPEALQAWVRKWFDPRNGEPGWQWLVTGTSDRIRRRLARITPLSEPTVP
ncbi:MAG: hypothetical protein K0V04_17680 [Deltaproteobacteria bacterium]|nr:hypothetical protein [Deltaproteobacteria bacterium]